MNISYCPKHDNLDQTRLYDNQKAGELFINFIQAKIWYIFHVSSNWKQQSLVVEWQNIYWILYDVFQLHWKTKQNKQKEKLKKKKFKKNKQTNKQTKQTKQTYKTKVGWNIPHGVLQWYRFYYYGYVNLTMTTLFVLLCVKSQEAKTRDIIKELFYRF